MVGSYLQVSCVVRIALAIQPAVYVPTELLLSSGLYYLARGCVIHNNCVRVQDSVWGTDCLLGNAARHVPASK